ncbi:MAG: hypothetical protein KAH54_11365 [Candidatus Sabulitectum sp.]|nr:hypothetical protein [Candidatus Sabulitectum sp.]
MIKKITIGGSLLLVVPAVNASGTHIEEAEIQSVIESQNWETLKDIWRIADHLNPSEEHFEFPMATEKGDSLSSIVRSLFTVTDFASPEIQTAVSMILRITENRVLRASRINTTMLTRMIPTWTLLVRENHLFNFEERITTLTRLVEAGEITPPEFIAARDSLLDKAEILTVLEILEEVQIEPDYGFYPDPIDELDADVILARLDLSYRAALDTLNKQNPSEYLDHYKIAVQQHEEFLRRYSEFEDARPVLRILLTDLMEAEI